MKYMCGTKSGKGLPPLLRGSIPKLALILIDLGLTSSTLGSVSVSTPFLNSALALSVFTRVGRLIERWNAP
jgi:hypothetical protein